MRPRTPVTWVVWIRYRSGWEATLSVNVVPGCGERSPREWLQRFILGHSELWHRQYGGWQKKYGKDRFPSPEFALAPQGRIPKVCR